MIRKISYAILMGALAIVPLVATNGCAVAGRRESAGQYGKDKEIAARIKTDLYRDPVVKGTEVNVTSLRGNVQLSGFVDNQAQKDRAGQIASQIPGVASVHNDLIVGATGR